MNELTSSLEAFPRRRWDLAIVDALFPRRQTGFDLMMYVVAHDLNSACKIGLHRGHGHDMGMIFGDRTHARRPASLLSYRKTLFSEMEIPDTW